MCLKVIVDTPWTLREPNLTRSLPAARFASPIHRLQSFGLGLILVYWPLFQTHSNQSVRKIWFIKPITLISYPKSQIIVYCTFSFFTPNPPRKTTDAHTSTLRHWSPPSCFLFIWVQEKMAFSVSKTNNKLVPKSAVSSLNSDCALRVEFINVSSKKIKTFWLNFLSKPLI